MLYLTQIEKEILQEIAKGKTTAEIAAARFRSVKTIDIHRRDLRKKLGARSSAHLIVKAIQAGVLQLDFPPQCWPCDTSVLSPGKP